MTTKLNYRRTDELYFIKIKHSSLQKIVKKLKIKAKDAENIFASHIDEEHVSSIHTKHSTCNNKKTNNPIKTNKRVKLI